MCAGFGEFMEGVNFSVSEIYGSLIQKYGCLLCMHRSKKSAASLWTYGWVSRKITHKLLAFCWQISEQRKGEPCDKCPAIVADFCLSPKRTGHHKQSPRKATWNALELVTYAMSTSLSGVSRLLVHSMPERQISLQDWDSGKPRSSLSKCCFTQSC